MDPNQQEQERGSFGKSAARGSTLTAEQFTTEHAGQKKKSKPTPKKHKDVCVGFE